MVLAASRTALMVDDEVQLNAGSAIFSFRQCSINLSKLSPVITPGGTRLFNMIEDSYCKRQSDDI